MEPTEQPNDPGDLVESSSSERIVMKYGDNAGELESANQNDEETTEEIVGILNDDYTSVFLETPGVFEINGKLYVIAQGSTGDEIIVNLNEAQIGTVDDSAIRIETNTHEVISGEEAIQIMHSSDNDSLHVEQSCELAYVTSDNNHSLENLNNISYHVHLEDGTTEMVFIPATSEVIPTEETTHEKSETKHEKNETKREKNETKYDKDETKHEKLLQLAVVAQEFQTADVKNSESVNITCMSDLDDASTIVNQTLSDSVSISHSNEAAEIPAHLVREQESESMCYQENNPLETDIPTHTREETSSLSIAVPPRTIVNAVSVIQIYSDQNFKNDTERKSIVKEWRTEKTSFGNNCMEQVVESGKISSVILPNENYVEYSNTKKVTDSKLSNQRKSNVSSDSSNTIKEMDRSIIHCGEDESFTKESKSIAETLNKDDSNSETYIVTDEKMDVDICHPIDFSRKLSNENMYENELKEGSNALSNDTDELIDTVINENLDAKNRDFDSKNDSQITFSESEETPEINSCSETASPSLKDYSNSKDSLNEIKRKCAINEYEFENSSSNLNREISQNSSGQDQSTEILNNSGDMSTEIDITKINQATYSDGESITQNLTFQGALTPVAKKRNCNNIFKINLDCIDEKSHIDVNEKISDEVSHISVNDEIKHNSVSYEGNSYGISNEINQDSNGVEIKYNSNENETNEGSIDNEMNEDSFDVKISEESVDDKMNESSVDDKMNENSVHDKVNENSINVKIIKCDDADQIKEDSANGKMTRDTSGGKMKKDSIDSKMSEDSVDSKMNEDSADCKMNQDNTDCKMNEDSVDSKMNEDSVYYKMNEDSADSKMNEDSADSKMNEDSADSKMNEDSIYYKMNEDTADGNINKSVTDDKINKSSADDKMEEDSTDGQMDGDVADGQMDEDVADGQMDEDNTDSEMKGDNADSEMKEDNADGEMKGDVADSEKGDIADVKMKGDNADFKIKEDSADGKIKEDSADCKIKEDSDDSKMKEDSADGKIKEDSADGKIKEDSADCKIKEDSADGKIKEVSADSKMNEGSADGKMNEGSADGKSNECSADDKSKEGSADGKSNEGSADDKSNEGRADDKSNEGSVFGKMHECIPDGKLKKGNANGKLKKEITDNKSKAKEGSDNGKRNHINMDDEINLRNVRDKINHSTFSDVINPESLSYETNCSSVAEKSLNNKVGNKMNHKESVLKNGSMEIYDYNSSDLFDDPASDQESSSSRRNKSTGYHAVIQKSTLEVMEQNKNGKSITTKVVEKANGKNSNSNEKIGVTVSNTEVSGGTSLQPAGTSFSADSLASDLIISEGTSIQPPERTYIRKKTSLVASKTNDIGLFSIDELYNSNDSLLREDANKKSTNDDENHLNSETAEEDDDLMTSNVESRVIATYKNKRRSSQRGLKKKIRTMNLRSDHKPRKFDPKFIEDPETACWGAYLMGASFKPTSTENVPETTSTNVEEKKAPEKPLKKRGRPTWFKKSNLKTGYNWAQMIKSSRPKLKVTHSFKKKIEQKVKKQVENLRKSENKKPSPVQTIKKKEPKIVKKFETDDFCSLSLPLTGNVKLSRIIFLNNNSIENNNSVFENSERERSIATSQNSNNFQYTCTYCNYASNIVNNLIFHLKFCINKLQGDVIYCSNKQSSDVINNMDVRQRIRGEDFNVQPSENHEEMGESPESHFSNASAVETPDEEEAECSVVYEENQQKSIGEAELQKQTKSKKKKKYGFADKDVIWAKVKHRFWPAIIWKLDDIETIIYLIDHPSKYVGLHLRTDTLKGQCRSFNDAKWNKKLLEDAARYKDNDKFVKAVQKCDSYTRKNFLYEIEIDAFDFFSFPKDRILFMPEDVRNEVDEPLVPLDPQQMEELEMDELDEEFEDIKEIMSCILDGYCDDHLVSIYQKEVSSERNEMYFSKDNGCSSKLKDMSWFSPFRRDSTMQIKLFDYFFDVFKSRIGDQDDMATYIYEVWIPEALIKAISIVRNLDMEEAEFVFSKQGTENGNSIYSEPMDLGETD